MHLEQELLIGICLKEEAGTGPEKCVLEWREEAKSCWGTNELFNLIICIYFGNF